MYETIIYEVTGRVARITLNRPEARNSLSDQMTGELLNALETAKGDDGVRVIVLTGAGDRAFCAGADLGGLGQAQRTGGPIVGVTASRSSPSSPADGEEGGAGGPADDGPYSGRPYGGGTGDGAFADMASAGAGGAAGGGVPPTGVGGAAGGGSAHAGAGGTARTPGRSTDPIRGSAIYRLFTAFPELGKPVIARLAGSAVAGGLGLAASCDLVIAADDVKLATPEVNVGLWPMMIMAIINRNVAPKQAFKLYYTGQSITASEARDIGLVTEVVPRSELDARVDELAAVIAAKSPIGLRIGRNAFFATEGKPFKDQIAYLLGGLVEIAGTEDAKEGITAFLEKRTPDFHGM
ncbi:MAG TPA: enoyl-CoA hydratase-related protein [Streptosporangiaceae bacterium]|nr:enoyl-CoA hydratase-related protein [Streptosporangiaceae bacterium]